MNDKVKNKSSDIARRTAARLIAVQAVYQMLVNEQTAVSTIEEYKAHRLGSPLEGLEGELHESVFPDGNIFSKIVKGVEERQEEINQIIETIMSDKERPKPSQDKGSAEVLLKCIMICGVYELMAHHDIDAPIIISDYIEVTHAFYEGGEAKLVNAVLDKAKIGLRDD